MTSYFARALDPSEPERISVLKIQRGVATVVVYDVDATATRDASDAAWAEARRRAKRASGGAAVYRTPTYDEAIAMREAGLAPGGAVWGD